MARRATSTMKQASISEFFEKNKHFLGYDTLQRSVITAVKEAIDNSLDACEEHRILPTISIELRKNELVIEIEAFWINYQEEGEWRCSR